MPGVLAASPGSTKRSAADGEPEETKGDPPTEAKLLFVLLLLTKLAELTGEATVTLLFLAGEDDDIKVLLLFDDDERIEGKGQDAIQKVASPPACQTGPKP